MPHKWDVTVVFVTYIYVLRVYFFVEYSSGFYKFETVETLFNQIQDFFSTEKIKGSLNISTISNLVILMLSQVHLGWASCIVWARSEENFNARIKHMSSVHQDWPMLDPHGCTIMPKFCIGKIFCLPFILSLLSDQQQWLLCFK